MNDCPFPGKAKDEPSVKTWILSGLLMLLLSACSGPEAESTGGLWEDDRGKPVSPALTPRRMVVLSPSLVEMVYALGEESRITAVSRYCRWPDEARELPQVGGGLDPDTETILGLQPDLILSSVSSLSPPLMKLEDTGIPVALLNQTTLDDIFYDFRKLSAWLGVESRGLAILEQWRDERAQLESWVKERPAPKPATVILYDFQSLLSAGKHSFASDLVQLAGGLNLPDQTGEPWPVLSPEMLLKWNPEVILFSLNGNETPKEVKAGLQQFRNDPRWSNLKAVRSDRLHTIPDSQLAIPGPRSLFATQSIARLLYPETPPPPP